MKVGIWGSGFIGDELAKLLDRPGIEIVRKKIGYEIEEIEEKDISAGFLGLPPKQSMDLVPVLLEKGIKVFDLSGAYRLKDPTQYPPYYKFEHTHPELLKEAVYGLPEINRESIKSASLVSNPGCYATAAILGLLPLSRNNLLSAPRIEIDAASGYSGAGKGKEIPKWPAKYKSDREHQHVPEIEQVLNILGQLHFFPEITPLFRGLICYIHIDMEIKEKDLVELYQEFYKNEPFVGIIPREFRAKRGYDLKSEFDAVAGTNLCEISVGTLDRTLGRYVKIVSLLDNLGKGGAGQAIQNFNIAYGFPEELVY